MEAESYIFTCNTCDAVITIETPEILSPKILCPVCGCIADSVTD